MADLQANKRAADKETNSNENSNESKPIPPPRNVTKKRNKMDYDSMTDSELSDWETRSFGHTNITSPPLIPRQSVESNSPHGSPNKRSYPPLFDTGLDSTNFSTDLFPKKKYTDRFNWSPDKENRFHGNWNNSISSHDSAIGGSLFSAFGSVLTDSSSSFESQVNSEESASNLSSPAHSVYGRYQKTLGEESKGTKAENDIETLVLHRLPGENLGMILGINGGRSKDAVSEVYVKTVTIGGAAYRATGGTKGIEVGDRILQINGTDINTLTHDECLSVLREMPLRVILQIRRNHNKKIPVVTSPAMSVRSQRSYASSQYGMNNDYSESSSYSESEDDGNFDGFNLIQVEIDKNPDESLGLSIVPSYGSTRHFYQIKRILPSGAAARCQQLKVGDRLVSCNGLSLRNVSQSQCLTTLKSEGNSGDLELEVLRQSEHESQLEISLKVSNRAGIAGGYDSTVTLRSPNSERHFFSEVPNSDSDNEVVLNKFQFIDDQNNYRQSEPYQYSKRGDRNDSINRSLSSERDRDTDSEVAAITDKNKTSKMDPSDTYIPPPMEFSAFGPAVPPPEEFSQGQSPIFDQRGNSGMPVTNIDEILNSYSQTGMISTGPVDSAETNSSSFNPPIISDETEFVNNENGFQQSESFTGLEKDENDSLNNSIEINGDLNDSLNIAAPVEFSNQENINVSESYLRKEDQDENILKSDFSSQQQVSGTDYTMKDEICIKLNNSVVESVDEHSKDRDVWNNNTLNKQTKHISDPDSEELVVPVKVQRQNLQNSSILYSEDPEDVSMSSGDIEEDIIVPSVIKRQNLSESSVAVKKQKTDTEDEEKAVPIPRPRPQPRKGKSNVKSPTEKRQMDADLISHPKYPPPVQFENEAAVEEEVMTPILQPKQNVSKIIVEKVGPKIQEDTILPVEVKRGENSWNAAKMLVITNMWAKSASENQEKQNVQDVSSNLGFKDVIGLVSKAEQMEGTDLEEDDKVADSDSNTAAIEEVVVDVNLADDSDKTLKYIASDQDETPKHVTTVTVSHDLESDINQTNKDGDVIISDNEFKQVLEPQDTTQNDSEKTVGLNESLTVSVKNIGEESAPVQTITSLENVDFSVKSVEKDEVDKNEVNQNIVQADGNRTVINLSPGSENSEMTNMKLNVQVSSAIAKENKLPENTTSNNVPENPPSITSPRQYKSSVSVTKPQSILGTIKSQNASSGLKPLSSIKPLTVSAKTFSLSKPVKYATTISTSSGKPSLLSTIHGSALLSTSSSAKNTRSEDEPFLVSVLKGILGLGMKVVVTPEGAVQVTEIQQNGPIAKDGNIRVGDYLLSINSTELTGLPDNKVQQMLRLLPRGIAKIMVSATGIKTTGEEDQTKANKPEEQKPQASKVDEKRSTQRTSLASMASPVVHSKRIPTTTSESSQSPVSSDVPQSQSLTSTPPLSSIKSSQDKHPEINESNDSKLVETVLESNIPKISQDFELKKDESVLEGNVVSSKKVPPKVAPKPKQRTSANETATHKFSSVKGQGGYVSSAVGRSKSFEKKNVPNVERDPPFQKHKANYVSSAQKISAPAEKDDQMDNGPIDTIIFASINDSKDKPVSASNIENPNGPEPKLIPKGHVDYVTPAKPKQGPATAPKPKHFTSNPPLHKSKDIPLSPYAYEETTKKVVPTRLNSALSPRRKSSDQGAFKFGANSSKSPSKDNPVATNIAMDMINDKHLEATTTINSDLEKPLQSGEVYTNTNTMEQNQGEDERIAKSKVEDGTCEEKNELVFGDGLVNTNIQPQSTASVICMQASPDPTQSPNNACSGLDVVESPSVQGMHTDLQTNVKLDNLVMSDPFSMQESSLPEDSKNNRGDTLCDDEVNLNVVNSSEIVHCENVNVFNKFNQDSCTDTLTSDSNVGDQTVLDEEHSKGNNSNSENAEKFKLKEKSDNLGSDDNKMPPVHIDYSGIVSRRPWSLILGQQEVYVSSAPQNVCHLSDLNLSATSNTVCDQEVCVFLDKTNDAMDRLSLPVEDEIIVISLQRQSMDIPVGLTLKQGERGGILVSGILPGGLIPENGKIGINDHLHLVNGESVESKELNDVTESFDKLSADIILTISKNSTQERYPETTSVSQFEELIDIQNSQDEESSDDSPPALPGSPPPLPPKSDLPDVGIDMTNVTDNDRKSETDDVNPTEMPDKVIEIDTSLNKEISFNENTPKIPDIIESALIHDTVDEKNKKVEDIGNTEDPNVISSSKEDSLEDTNLKSAEEFPEKYKTERNRDVEVNGKNDESPATSPAPVFENLELPASDDGGETKTHEVSMHKGVTGLGFLIEGGIASPRGDQPISIRRIFKGGPAEKCGHLKVKDVILCVNGVDISQMRHSEAWTHLKFLDDGEVKLLIQRKEENI